ncbi:MAG TPA: transglycosylase SLT domain-containing protein [Kineosporiaceae bacterium]|nr:transglycosylase SLT domain-containing protein [Kineosporiaceae bacterium]
MISRRPGAGTGRHGLRTGLVALALAAAFLAPTGPQSVTATAATASVAATTIDVSPTWATPLDVTPVLAVTPSAPAANAAPAATASATSAGAQATAKAMLAQRGWSGQWQCLNALWQRESGWKFRATNRSSGAYGIPQALPGRKMAGAGKDWKTNPATQIRWGLSYIASRYGTPCKAWAHSRATGWY